MARATGLGQIAVWRIWRAFGLKPHVSETWKYLRIRSSSRRSATLSGSILTRRTTHWSSRSMKKSNIQALDCAVPANAAHDPGADDPRLWPARHGLFAGMDVASGSVIVQHYRRHRHQDFLRFLKLIDAAVPDGLGLQLICDNYATHKTRK
jgi:hypothetical protein